MISSTQAPLTHLAIEMDGNRRWAKSKGLMPWLGHKQGVESVKQVIEFALEQNIKIISLYTLSIENLKRSQQELDFIFNLIIEQAQSQVSELKKNGVKVKFLGDQKYWPAAIAKSIRQLEEDTAGGAALQLNLLFCYGAQQEILAAAAAMANSCPSYPLMRSEDEARVEVFDKAFESHLLIQRPYPDLIVRTGGQMRLSNFMLYQAAYSELYFTNKLWPELTKSDLVIAIQEYQARIRNYGA